MKSIVAATSLLLVTASMVAFCGATPKTHARSTKAISSQVAWVLMNKQSAALGKRVKGVTPTSVSGNSTPLKRTDLLIEFDRIFEQVRPSIRWTPNRARIVEAEIVKGNQDPKIQQIIRKLSRFGCIAPVGPVVVGPGQGLTPTEFGDAVGMFTIRMAQLTHQPDPKWTPDLRNEKDGR